MGPCELMNSVYVEILRLCCTVDYCKVIGVHVAFFTQNCMYKYSMFPDLKSLSMY